MTKRATSRKKLQLTPKTLRQALDELGINVPYYEARLVGNRIEFHLYGGQLVTWTPPTDVEAAPRGRPEEEPK